MNSNVPLAHGTNTNDQNTGNHDASGTNCRLGTELFQIMVTPHTGHQDDIPNTTAPFEQESEKPTSLLFPEEERILSNKMITLTVRY